MPVVVLGGILIAIFGIPLGFGGVAVLVGILLALCGVVVAYYLAGGAVLLAGTVSVLVGMTRMYRPELWDSLVASGFIHIDVEAAEFLDRFSPSDQGGLIIAFGFLLVAIAVGMLWLGKYPFRGLRFLFSLAFEWTQGLAQRLLRVARRYSTTKGPVLSSIRS